ncbi:MAG: hypothetical protein K8R91_04675, partial [Phycisphaerae bacterium]|nr:hypothetical protein [Phycisphaerae bacterium]
MSLICAAVFSITITTSWADETWWQHDPATPGDWFDDANWTSGVPGLEDYASIYNGGTAVIAAGDALAKHISIGRAAGRYPPSYLFGPPCLGALVQTGGTATFSGSIYMSGSLDAPGTYTMSGGRLSVGRVVVGHGLGSGHFVQIGGISSIGGELKVGDLPSYYGEQPSLDSSLGTYALMGGKVSTGRTSVGQAGRGEFIQTGGVHTVEDTLTIGGLRQQLQLIPGELPGLIPIYGPPDSIICPDQFVSINAMAHYVTPNVIIPPPPPSEGRYELSGGRLGSQQVKINRTGLMRQTGGANRTGYLSIDSGGRYEYLGGSLKISAGLDLDGEFDFGGSSANLIAGRSLLNFSRGEVLNAESASITVGPDSLTIFAGDFDPHTQLKRFRTAGLVHFAGSDLVLSANQGFTGWGSIDDHVETSGHILATDGGRIDLREGLFLHEGTVDLGDGQLMVRNDLSGMEGGQLAGGSMTIGSPVVGSLRPDGTFITYP